MPRIKKLSSKNQHLDWCKKRALGCLEAGNRQEAFASLASDLTKSAETDDPLITQLGLIILMRDPSDIEGMRKFIEDTCQHTD